MIPATTRRLAIAACLLTAVWLWVWNAWKWTLELPTVNLTETAVLGESWTSFATIKPAVAAAIDSTAWLQSPAFYPDRQAHSYRPGATNASSALAPVSAPDFELTTTVVGTTQAFAVLRPAGSNYSMIARRGEELRDAPGWRVVGIERFSIQLVDGSGHEVDLQLKPHAFAPVATMPASLAPVTVSNTDASPMSPPPPATQPAQGDANLRARIQARRHAVTSDARNGKVQ